MMEMLITAGVIRKEDKNDKRLHLQGWAESTGGVLEDWS